MPRRTSTLHTEPGSKLAHHDEAHLVNARHHDHPRRHGEPSLTALSWGTAAFGLAIHSLVGGVALASAITADFAERRGVGATGWGVFLATVVHKPADALTIVTLMLSLRGFETPCPPGQRRVRPDDPIGRRPVYDRPGTA